MAAMLKVFAALAAVALLVAGCGGGSEDEASGGSGGGSSDKNITIGMIAWDEDIAVSHLWKAILEDKGYNVDIKTLDAAAIFTGAAQGDLDVFFDAWLPETHKDYWAKNKDSLEDLGVWYDNASLHLTVPNYVKIDSIADLKSNAAKFDGKITGIEPSAGEMRVVKQQVVPDYGLDNMKVVDSSTPAMLAALKRAIDKKEPIVVTLWRPHWAYAKLPIKDLKDPKGSMGEAEQIHTIAREGFSSDMPEVSSMLKNFTLDDKTLGSLEDALLNQAEDGQEDEATQEWIKSHQDVVDTLTAKS